MTFDMSVDTTFDNTLVSKLEIWEICHLKKKRKKENIFRTEKISLKSTVCNLFFT